MATKISDHSVKIRDQNELSVTRPASRRTVAITMSPQTTEGQQDQNQPVNPIHAGRRCHPKPENCK